MTDEISPEIRHEFRGGESLPWASSFTRSCRAVIPPDNLRYWGRCELRTAHQGDHALERGMVWVRWSIKSYEESPQYFTSITETNADD